MKQAKEKRVMLNEFRSIRLYNLINLFFIKF